jgi:hypothetical protein
LRVRGIELFNVPWFTATQREVEPDKLAGCPLDFLLSYGLAPVGLALCLDAVAGVELAEAAHLVRLGHMPRLTVEAWPGGRPRADRAGEPTCAGEVKRSRPVS